MEKLNEDAETRRAVGTCKDRRDCAFRVNFALILCEILTNVYPPFFRQKLEIFRTGRKNYEFVDGYSLIHFGKTESDRVSLHLFGTFFPAKNK